MAASSPRDFIRPQGDVKTVLDATDRDFQDDTLFPINADLSWFSADTGRKNIYFAPQVQTFQFRGPAQFGSRFSFEIDRVNAGDLIHMIAIQIRLGHWLDENTRSQLLNNTIRYQNPQDAWTYTNGIGRTLIESAEFQVDDTVLETVDTVSADCIVKLFPDINNVFGFGRDGTGYASPQELITTPSAGPSQEPTGMFDPQRPFTTENGDVFCLVPFFFTRHPYRGSFPLLSVNHNGRVRINFNLRPFDQCVRSTSGLRESCTESPLGKTFTFVNNLTNATFDVIAAQEPPPFQDIKMIVYSTLLGDEVRQKYIRNTYECMYRSLQPFLFTEPLKYAVASTNSSVDSVRVQLPLEFNHPVEEIFWVIRRTAQEINNNWLDFSSYTEKQQKDNADLIQTEPLIDGTIYINGIPIAQLSGQAYRYHLAELHLGGIVPYASYIYGYSFARRPGAFTPSGTVNMSRSSSCRLDLNVRVPVAAPGAFTQAQAQTWEVLVYGIGINWLRFQNGMCSRIYNS